MISCPSRSPDGHSYAEVMVPRGLHLILLAHLEQHTMLCTKSGGEVCDFEGKDPDQMPSKILTMSFKFLGFDTRPRK